MPAAVARDDVARDRGAALITGRQHHITNYYGLTPHLGGKSAQRDAILEVLHADLQ
jgi:hypothetical protein